MDNKLKIQPGNIIKTETLNNTIIGLYSYINSINYAQYVGGTAATSATSGVIQFTNTLSSSTISGNYPAISPATLSQNIENGPMTLNTYYGNDISNNVMYLNTTMQYILLPNKVIMMFGKLIPPVTNYYLYGNYIHLDGLFRQTPYTLSALYFIRVDTNGAELVPNELALNMARSIVLAQITKDTIVIPTTEIYYSIPVPPYSLAARTVNWFALGKIN